MLLSGIILYYILSVLHDRLSFMNGISYFSFQARSTSFAQETALRELSYQHSSLPSPMRPFVMGRTQTSNEA